MNPLFSSALRSLPKLLKPSKPMLLPYGMLSFTGYGLMAAHDSWNGDERTAPREWRKLSNDDKMRIICKTAAAGMSNGMYGVVLAPIDFAMSIRDKD